MTIKLIHPIFINNFKSKYW